MFEDEYNKHFEQSSSIIINFFFTIRNVNSLFDLLSNEKNRESSEESINELAYIDKPTFKLPLNKDFRHYYQEFEITVSDQDLILIIYYKPSDDTFNVSLKLKNANTHNRNLLLSFSSLIYFEEDISKNKVHSFITISNTKTQTNIFRIEDFTNYSKENFQTNKKNMFQLCVILKLCNMHSVFSTHLAINFNRHYQDTSIIKVNKQFLQTLLKSDLRKENEDSVVIAVTNWLQDELNISDDIHDILDYISWSDVSHELALEFFLKFYNIFEGADCENKIVSGIEKSLIKKELEYASSN